MMKRLFCCLMVFLLSLPAIYGRADAEVGDSITFGSWHQDSDAQDSTPIQWLVLEKQGDRALLLSSKALDARPYDLYRVDAAWDQCTLRVWLNTEFLNEAFTPDQQKAILVTTMDNGTACPATEDKLFLLNYPELCRYLSAEQRIAHYTRYASPKDGLTDAAFSWTREPDHMINFVGTECFDLFQISENAVRPAMWISLSAAASPESAPARDFTPPTAFVPERTEQGSAIGGTVYRCLLLRGPQWKGRNSKYGYMLTDLMPDETIFYPEVGFPETSGSDVRKLLDNMAQLADDDDVTYILIAAHGESHCYDFYQTTDYFSENAFRSDNLPKATLIEKATAIRGHVIILSLSCFSGTLMEYCGQLDPDRCTIWMSCGREEYAIGSTEKLLYHACTAVQDDESGAIELGEISAFQLKADDAAPCVYGNPANFVFPVK